MDPRVLQVFCVEVERQCKFAITATDDLQAALSRTDTNRVWYSIQAFLVAVGNLSKLLWGLSAQKSRERSDLRTALSVDENSPLKCRAFRNDFEHFDERIEAWRLSTTRRNFVDSNIGPISKIISGVDPGDYLRNFDHQDFTLLFRGQQYDLKPVMEAVLELYQRALTVNCSPTSPY